MTQGQTTGRTMPVYESTVAVAVANEIDGKREFTPGHTTETLKLMLERSEPAGYRLLATYLMADMFRLAKDHPEVAAIAYSLRTIAEFSAYQEDLHNRDLRSVRTAAR